MPYETPHILHDKPLRDNEKAHFHFKEFAITLARLAASTETDTPVTVGISGPWGSGKTTLLKRVKFLLDEPIDKDGKHRFANGGENQEKFRKCKTVWFEAWKYADEDELLVALIRVILNTMAKGSFGEKILKESLDPHKPEYDVVAGALAALKIKLPFVEISPDPKKYEIPSPFENHTAFFDHFDEAFETLLARWAHGKRDIAKINDKAAALVIFIDDLDRCLPEKVVQVLEAVKLFLDKPGCVFMLGADLRQVQKAVLVHYKDTELMDLAEAKDYLEKIIQLRFEIPPVQKDKMQGLLDEKGVVAADWGESWRALITGAEVNPRKVKTFVNDLNLHWAMLKNSGQAQDVNRHDFNSWQVLMRAAPENFIKRVREVLKDQDLRYKFIQEAMQWAQGDEDLASTFREYAESLRLRRVLGELAFSPEFTPAALDSFVYLTALPVLEEPEPAQRGQAKEQKKILRGQSIKPPQHGSEKGVMRHGGQLGHEIYTFDGSDIEFVKIPAGKFIMGSLEDDADAYSDEKPQHTVEITKDYYIGRFPVTNVQYQVFVRDANREPPEDWNGAQYSEDKADHPVVNVSWHDAMAYCEWLSQKTGKDYRLPTEAEWEKAARGEYGNIYPWGNEWDAEKCNTAESGIGGTTPVGKYSPDGDSPYGCADMAGNVWEWCADWYAEGEYKRRVDEVVKDPRGPDRGDYRVLRGGSWDFNHRVARVSARELSPPYDRWLDFGFRVVCPPSKK